MYSVISYPLAVINVFVALGLIILYFRPFDEDRVPKHWNPPFKASLPVVIFFFLSNIYLVAAPFVPPEDGQNVYESLPYWLHCVVGIAFFVAGAVYWLFWAVIVPKIGGYKLVKEVVITEEGWSESTFRTIKNQ